MEDITIRFDSWSTKSPTLYSHYSGLGALAAAVRAVKDMQSDKLSNTHEPGEYLFTLCNLLGEGNYCNGYSIYNYSKYDREDCTCEYGLWVCDIKTGLWFNSKAGLLPRPPLTNKEVLQHIRAESGHDVFLKMYKLLEESE